MSLPLVTNPKEVAGARAAAQRVVETHRRLSGFLRRGQTLAQIDAFVAKTLEDLSCRSCFHGYHVRGHPKFPSHACLSVNECIVHGTAGYHTEPMREGDLLKIDIGVFFEGWVGDAAWTYVFGEPQLEVRRLMNSGKEALKRAIPMLAPRTPYLKWAQTVQDVVEKEYGFRCIQHWGGHGYGRALHGPPHLLNHRPVPAASWPEASHEWKPGTLIAVEPMIAVATGETFQKPLAGRLRDWPVFVAEEGDDGKPLSIAERLSVHYEHDVLVTENGPDVLTAGLEEVEDVIRS
jgi:methionyl aminopeptidase